MDPRAVHQLDIRTQPGCVHCERCCPMNDSTPADTRIMTIVHNGLRRDLERVQRALSDWPYPDPLQRAAIADQMSWIIQFLHKHHHAEDDGLYPVVRKRVPMAAGILDVMDRDHH